MVSNGDGIERFARVKVPDSLPQLVPVPAPDGEVAFIWLEQLLVRNLAMLFPEMEIVESSLFHVTRDAELAIQELEADDFSRVCRKRFGSDGFAMPCACRSITPCRRNWLTC